MAQRVRIHQAGSWGQLQIEEFDCADPGDEEVKIDVEAAGVNFADVSVRQGLYSSAREFIGWPITPGFEVAGKVSAVGKNVKEFKKGDRVVAATFFGGYSSQVLVKKAYVRTIPTSLGFLEAASIPVNFLTSYYSLYWLIRVHKGSTALVHSAAGGVGLAVTQVLKNAGCNVVGVVGSSKKVATASIYGVDTVIDKSNTDLWPALEKIAPNGFDLIFDPNGVSTLHQSYNHLAPTGFLFVYGFHSMFSKSKGRQNPLVLAKDYVRTPRFNPFHMVKTNRSVIGFNISYLYQREDILKEAYEFIFTNFQKKLFKPLPITEYAFKDVAQAHKDLESGKTIGKLVLKF